MAAAGRALLLAVTSKFGRTARAEIAAIEAFAAVVTDDPEGG